MENRSRRVRVVGPLAPYADGFRAVLAERGYAPSSAAGQLQLMAHLSRWLDRRGLAGHGLGPVVVEQFLSDRRTAGYGQWLSTRGMGPLLEYLRQAGVAPAPPAVVETRMQMLLAAYRVYLVEERGLAASTVRNYLSVAQQLASYRGASDQADLGGVTAAEVSEFRAAQVPGEERRVGLDPRRWVACGTALPASGRDHADGLGGRCAVGGVLASDHAAETDQPG